MVLLKHFFTKRNDELLRSTVALVTGPIIRSRRIVWSLEYRPLLQAANSSCKMEGFSVLLILKMKATTYIYRKSEMVSSRTTETTFHNYVHEYI